MFQRPTSSNEDGPPPPQQPLKLTFRLGGGAPNVSSPNPSSLATPSPMSEPMDYAFSADRDDDEPMSEANSTHQDSPGPDRKPTTVGGLLAAVPPGESATKEKPKRKRAPKRPAGEPGPGKHWRKGLKGSALSLFARLARMPCLQPLRLLETSLAQPLLDQVVRSPPRPHLAVPQSPDASLPSRSRPTQRDRHRALPLPAISRLPSPPPRCKLLPVPPPSPRLLASVLHRSRAQDRDRLPPSAGARTQDPGTEEMEQARQGIPEYHGAQPASQNLGRSYVPLVPSPSPPRPSSFSS